MRKSKKTTLKTTAYQPVFVSQAANQLSDYLKTSVSAATNSEGKGVIKINFESQEQLQQILNRIKGEK